MANRRIVILTAVRLEAKAVARALGLTQQTGETWNSPAAGSDQQVALFTIGIGARKLPANVQSSDSCIIMAGMAGALDPSLKVADIVIDDCPPAWRDGLAARFGAIHTSGKIATTPSEKAALFQQTAALAVDMENAVVREWAKKTGVPLVCVRAISDAADQTLDPAVLRFIDDMGRVRPLALAAELLARPSLVPALIRLGADSRRAATALGRAVQAICRQIP